MGMWSPRTGRSCLRVGRAISRQPTVPRGSGGGRPGPCPSYPHLSILFQWSDGFLRTLSTVEAGAALGPSMGQGSRTQQQSPSLNSGQGANIINRVQPCPPGWAHLGRGGTSCHIFPLPPFRAWVHLPTHCSRCWRAGGVLPE